MSPAIQNSSHPALSGADGLAAATSDIILLVGRILIGWILRLRENFRHSFLCLNLPATRVAYFSRLHCCPGGFFRRSCVNVRIRDPLRRVGDGGVYAGGDFQFAPLLGLRRCNRPTCAGFKFL